MDHFDSQDLGVSRLFWLLIVKMKLKGVEFLRNWFHAGVSHGAGYQA